VVNQPSVLRQLSSSDRFQGARSVGLANATNTATGVSCCAGNHPAGIGLNASQPTDALNTPLRARPSSGGSGRHRCRVLCSGVLAGYHCQAPRGGLAWLPQAGIKRTGIVTPGAGPGASGGGGRCRPFSNRRNWQSGRTPNQIVHRHSRMPEVGPAIGARPESNRRPKPPRGDGVVGAVIQVAGVTDGVRRPSPAQAERPLPTGRGCLIRGWLEAAARKTVSRKR